MARRRGAKRGRRLQRMADTGGDRAAARRGEGKGATGEERLAMEDAVMEPSVWEVLKECLQRGARPDTLTELLSDGYQGYAQMVNLLCEW